MASPETRFSSLEDPLVAFRVRAGIGDVVALAVEADDEHGAAVEVAARLVGRDYRGHVPIRGDVTHALAEAAPAELVCATEKVDGIVGVERGNAGFHGPEMLVT